MRIRSSAKWAVVAMALCVGLPAQDLSSADGAESTTAETPADRSAGSPAERSAAAAVPAGAFMVPIHTAAADNGREYGVWASGPDYKVSFHDGMTFYPVLGASAPRNLPVRWETTSVRTGDGELLGDSVSTYHSDWRYEYRHGNVTEAYDVRTDGVEQTFVLHTRPAQDGDLVVRGRFASELVTDATAPRIGDLVLRDASGRAVVRYGKALAIDAAGRTRDMLTSFDGSDVELRLSADFLANATYPLTVDPLVANAIVAVGGAQPMAVSIARNNREDELAVAFIRRTSSGDEDVYMHLMKDDWAFSTLVFADLSANWGSRYVDVAYVAASRRWVLVEDRRFSSSALLRVHYHDGGDFSLGSVVSALTSTDWASELSVGGSVYAIGHEALIVYREDIGNLNTSSSTIRGILVNASTKSKIIDFDISSSTTSRDAEAPQVMERRRLSNRPWFVVYQEYNNTITGDDWDLFITRIHDDGQVDAAATIGNTSSTVHGHTAYVDGDNDFCMVTYLEDDNTLQYPGVIGTEVWTQRIDWRSTASTPQKGTRRQIHSGPTMRIGGIAYDSTTKSHWAVVVDQISGIRDRVVVDRVGADGVSAESTVLAAAEEYRLPSVTFDDDNNEFSIAFATPSLVLGNKLAYPAPQAPVVYGTGCGNANIRSRGTSHANLPWAGTTNFGIVLEGAPARTPAVLMIGGASGSFDLGAIGMTGCMLNLNPALILANINVQLASSRYDMPLRIPSAVSGDIFVQWLYINAAAPGGLEATQGMQITIQ